MYGVVLMFDGIYYDEVYSLKIDYVFGRVVQRLIYVFCTAVKR